MKESVSHPCPDCVQRGEDVREIEVGGYCRRDYNRRWRAAQQGSAVPPPRTAAQGLRGPLARPEKSEQVPCRTTDCPELVTVRGERLRRWREQGIAPYHSMECRVRGGDTWVEGQCACGCGQTWRKRRREVARNSTGRTFIDAKHAQQGGGTKPTTGREVTCDGCGEPMYVTPTQEGKKRFHGVPCRRRYEQRATTRRNCPICGAEFVVPPSQPGKTYDRKRCHRLAQITRAVPGQWHNGLPKRYDSAGYVLVYEPDHPGANVGGWVAEHRLVVEQFVGRYLSALEEVDHINEVKDDNRPENLRVKSKVEHAKITSASVHRRRVARQAELDAYRQLYGPLPDGGEAATLPAAAS